MPSVGTDGRLLPEQVAARMLTRILEGEFGLGEPLPREADLAAELGISRLTLREAVKALQNRGVLRIERGRGTYVNPRTDWSQLDPMVLDAVIASDAAPELYRHLTELRRVIETGMAGLAATRRTPSNLAQLRRTLDEMTDAAERGSIGDYATADLAFHDAVLTAAGNPLVDGVYAQLRSVLRDVRRETTTMAKKLSDGVAVHRAILDAIADRDADRATQAMLHHFDRTTRYVERAISTAFQTRREAAAPSPRRKSG